MPIPQVGDTAPDFATVNDAGHAVALSDYKGKRIVLYFYPRADTPGCTKQACAFRDHYGEFQKRDVIVLGVSRDTAEAQAQFKQKYNLPFTLLADADHVISELYGVWGTRRLKTEAGVEVDYTGIYRSTFLIDESGKISHALIGVDPANNASDVLALL